MGIGAGVKSEAEELQSLCMDYRLELGDYLMTRLGEVVGRTVIQKRGRARSTH